MAKKDFKVSDLFSDSNTGAKQEAPSEPKNKGGRKPIGVSRTLRAFRIEDALWNDFMIYVALCGGKQVDVINDIIREKIAQNADKIAQYRALLGDIK